MDIEERFVQFLKNNRQLFIIGLVITGFYIHTLFFPWRHFDEQIIYNELIYPIPKNLTEFFYYIKNFFKWKRFGKPYLRMGRTRIN